MLTYHQAIGTWFQDNRFLFGGCYAGMAEGKNNPAMESVSNIGPIPQGIYTIGPLHTIPHLGPAMPLTPRPSNVMHGRFGFFCHLDNPDHVGNSSDGCVVFPTIATLRWIDQLRSEGEDQVTVTV